MSLETLGFRGPHHDSTNNEDCIDQGLVCFVGIVRMVSSNMLKPSTSLWVGDAWLVNGWLFFVGTGGILELEWVG